jgi:16S rRNA (guanine(966)-N(2))-methyltransferase RsmD
MRVIAGQWRGRSLFSPGGSVRPTQDRVRQILFDILGDEIAEACVLDLYAGSGAVGIEALSRGAAQVTFVESDARVRRTLERNLDAVEAGPRARILGRPALAALRDLLASGAEFDWILADPPYGSPDVPRLLSWIGGEGAAISSGRGGLVLESGRFDDMPAGMGGLLLQRERVVGDTVLRFFRVEGGEERDQSGGATR